MLSQYGECELWQKNARFTIRYDGAVDYLKVFNRFSIG